MSAAAVLSRYRAVQVTTSSAEGVIVLLYDGLFRFLAEARVAMGNKDRAAAGERISRSIAILELLASSLDHAASPELCERLEGLYAFCASRLTAANVTQDTAPLDECARVLDPLRDAWRQVAK